MNETKKFSKMPDGRVLIHLTSDSDLMLNVAGKNERIGEIHQTNRQIVDADKVDMLKEWVNALNLEIEGKIENIKRQQEPLKGFDECVIPEKIAASMQDEVKRADRKVVARQMKYIEGWLQKRDKKINLSGQLSYLETQLKGVREDMIELNKL